MLQYSAKKKSTGWHYELNHPGWHGSTFGTEVAFMWSESWAQAATVI